MSSSINSVMTSRVTGLASGLDTESIVADLLAASKLKITEVEQKKQILEWKQQFYQEIATSLYNFQNKYFSGTTSLVETALTSMKATSSSSLVTVTASSASPTQNLYIHDIVSLATYTKVVSSDRVSSNPTIEILADTQDPTKLNALAGKSIVVNLNGSEKAITFSPNKEYSDVQDVLDELQTQLDKAFGKDSVKVDLSDNKLTLSADNSTLRIKMPTDGTDTADLLLFENTSNRIDMNVSLGAAGLRTTPTLTGEENEFEFTINGETFTAAANESLASIITKINNSKAGVKITYSQLTDTFTMTATESGAGADIEFSDVTGNLMASLFGGGKKTEGTDAVVKLSVNGSTDPADLIEVRRSTNNISFDGVSITLNGMAEANTAEKITVSLSRDVDALAETIKSFINDYNSLLSQITTKLSEEYDRNYLPLTEDQKKDMSEKEIELWTQKAKTGLLRNDTYLTSIANQLKSIFYSPVSSLASEKDSIGMLAEIGISTTVWSDKGKLTIDEKKLKEALSSNPDKVISLFTQKSTVTYSQYASQEQQTKRFNQSGVLDRLSDMLKNNLSKVGKKGALITLVGSPADLFKGETLYSKRIQELKERIDKLNDKLIDEEDRYWRQFTAMEKALANLNSQSSWLAGMLSNNNG